jgi:hypothetical protein
MRERHVVRNLGRMCAIHSQDPSPNSSGLTISQVRYAMQFREALLAPAVLKFRKHAESNTSIHTTRLSDRNFSYSLSPDEKVPAARPWLPSSPMMYCTAPRFWDERCLLYELVPIGFGCYFSVDEHAGYEPPCAEYCYRRASSIKAEER